MKTSKTLYTIVEKIGKRYKLKNISTGNDIKRLYPHFELVLNNHETVPMATPEPTAESQKFIGATPIKSRKERKPVDNPTEMQKFIGATPVKSRKSRKVTPESIVEEFN